MALTWVEGSRASLKGVGGLRMKLMDVTFDNAYSTGGWAVTAADVKVGSIETIVGCGPQAAADGITLGWNPTTSKLLAFKGAAGLLVEIAATDANGKKQRVIVWHR